MCQVSIYLTASFLLLLPMTSFGADNVLRFESMKFHPRQYQKMEKTEDTQGALKSVVCPGGSSQCPDGSTCCILASGDYGCCPKPNAVCCSDKIHCCPANSTCDVAQGTCKSSDGFSVLPWEKKTLATPTPQNVYTRGVVCPDGRTMCGDGQTCCKLSDSYGCCPYAEAVCCQDHQHCCPQSYTCNLAKQTCDKGDISLPMEPKQPPVHRLSSPVVCPGGKMQCPDQTTCCITDSGSYACCPSPNATCCSDHIHCCPNGYTCNDAQKTCEKDNLSIPYLKKQAASVKDTDSITCPDQSQCPTGQTCCATTSGGYACCPTPKATCCSDHVHCCPNGYTCNLSQQTCDKGQDIVKLLKKTLAVRAESVICPDKKSECQDQQTCCLLSSGQYGCCPTPNAVCCKDGQHCCPQGYKCESGQGACTKDGVTLPWEVKQPAKPRKETSVICPDKTSECPDSNTCCILSDGRYGCCPIANAVCCEDHLHCCPEGYKCEGSTQACTKDGLTLPWEEKVPAKPRLN